MLYKLLAVFTLSRLLLLTALVLIGGGQEFTDDADTHIDIAGKPFYQFQGLLPQHQQHPPLLGAVIAMPYQFIDSMINNSFISLRLSYIIFEVLGFFILLQALKNRSKEHILWLSLVITINPIGWMTSTIMAQDEVVSFVFCSIIAWLIHNNKISSALLACGIGFIAAKVFFIVIAGFLLVFYTAKILKKVLLFIAPILFCYTIVYLCQHFVAGYISGNEFSPRIVHGLNLWVAIVDSHLLNKEDAKITSSLIALIGLAFFSLQQAQSKITAEKTLLCIYIGLAWFFSSFYHATAEYLILMTPFLALGINTERFKACIYFILLGAMAYAVNLFHGVYWAFIKQTPGPKQTVVALYQQYIALDPLTMKYLAIALVNILLAVILFHSFHQLRNMTQASTAGLSHRIMQ